jgi:hypothetical protein
MSGVLGGFGSGVSSGVSGTLKRGIPGVITSMVDVHTLTCGDGYVVNYESDTGKVSCIRTASDLSDASMKQNFTSNVNEFKSRKGRNVESFSQNTNGKCKARY